MALTRESFMEGCIQVPPISFVDEGVGEVARATGEVARLSTLLVFVYSWSRTTAGRSLRPMPGRRAGPDYRFSGGLYFSPSASLYRDTRIRPGRLIAPDDPLAQRDILREIASPIHDAGLKLWAALWLGIETKEAAQREPALTSCVEVDAWGRPLGGDLLAHKWHVQPFLQSCFNNPDYRNFHLAMVEDLARTYPLDGIFTIPHERFGPIEATIVGGNLPTCFCAHCVARGEARGIDVSAARAGFQKLWEFAQRSSAEKQSLCDGALTRFLRLLVEFPEILQWEKLWADSVLEYQRDLYRRVKSARATLLVGLHVWQGASWGLFHRAEVLYERLADCADWIKPVLYDKPGGVRFIESYARQCHAALCDHVPFEDTARFLLAAQRLPSDRGVQDLMAEGFDPCYVRDETRRAKAAVGDRCAIYPGLGIDVQVPPTVNWSYPQLQPSDIIASVQAAAEGGARGFVLSVSYAQMRLESLAAVGEAVRRVTV